MSKTFASRHSLRFPRCKRVRWDKSPMDIQTDQELWDIVESNKGAIVGVSLAGCSAASHVYNPSDGLMMADLYAASSQASDDHCLNLLGIDVQLYACAKQATYQTLMRINVAGANGETAHTSPRRKQKKATPKKAAGTQRAQRSMVVEQFAPSSVAGVVQESSALKGALVYFVPSYDPARHSKADLAAMVARLGGKVLPVDASVLIL